MYDQYNNTKIYVHFGIGQAVWYIQGNTITTGRVTKVTISGDNKQIVHCDNGHYGTTINMARSKKELLKLLNKQYKELNDVWNARAS